MPDSGLQRRQQLYFKLTSALTQISNKQLHGLLDASATREGWGKNNVIEIEGSKVFVKRVPVTDLEIENMFSTRNFYDLPTYYNYGFNSAGFGVFRELVTHVKTTNWVLDGEMPTFPLLYHYRIVPFVGTHEETNMEHLAKYVKYWGGNANVGQYILDRAKANYELILCLEYFPHTLSSWLDSHLSHTPGIISDLGATFSFLRSKGVLHLDGHYSNVVTDGKRAYLTDFGLVLDKHFELSPAEKEFYRLNRDYDYGTIFWSLGSPLFHLYRNLSDIDKSRALEQLGLSAESSFEETLPLLLGNIEELAAKGILKLDKAYIASIMKYRDITFLMHSFFLSMRANDKKDTPFKSATLQRLLRKVDFPPALTD